MAEETNAAEPAAPAAPAAEPPWTEIFNENGRGYAELKGWKGPDDVLDSYRNLEKLHGVGPDRLLKLPGDEATPEEWEQIYTRLGRPETPEGYDFEMPEVPEGVPDLGPDFRQWAHSAGLSPKQASQIVEQYNERVTALTGEVQARAQESAAAANQNLQKEWGNEYQNNLQAVERFATSFGLDEGTLDGMRRGLGSEGAMKLAARIGRALSEHTFSDAESPSSGAPFGLTPAAAQAKISELMADSAFSKQYREDGPGHKEAVERMRKLHEVAHPEVAR